MGGRWDRMRESLAACPCWAGREGEELTHMTGDPYPHPPPFPCHRACHLPCHLSCLQARDSSAGQLYGSISLHRKGLHPPLMAHASFAHLLWDLISTGRLAEKAWLCIATMPGSDISFQLPYLPPTNVMVIPPALHACTEKRRTDMFL